MSIAGVVAGIVMISSPASASCGKVSITEMNWASSQIITEVSKFLMEQGYGCNVEKVPSATTTAVASLAENGEPDIVTVDYRGPPTGGSKPCSEQLAVAPGTGDEVRKMLAMAMSTS